MLQTLDIGYIGLMEQQLIDLPPSLKKLKCGSIQSDEATISNRHLKRTPFPAGLLVLEIRLTSNQAGNYYPESLQSLSLLIDDFRDDDIRKLPPSLTKLKLPKNRLLTGAAIPLLPRTIRRLMLNRCILLTDRCLRHMPPALKVLNLEFNTQFTDAGIRTLPKSLKLLDISSNQRVTKAVELYLPGVYIIAEAFVFNESEDSSDNDDIDYGY
jgi:hypothetical protein